MIRPLQTKVFPSIGSQQASALPMQSTVLPAVENGTTGGINLGELMNLMITMMIVVMMMKMMSGMMTGL